jgi:4-amino-4-deoxy-L-arabinose transferase-like glycosyltransferase
MGLPPTPRARLVLLHGAVPIRFAAPPGARLVWSPVGRRGDPEYVPASSLSPDPPDRATFDDPGRSLSDGLIALAILAVIIATLLELARHRLARVARRTWLAMGSVFVAAVVVRWIDLSGFGQAFDEDVNWVSGRNYVSNLLSLDFHARDWQWNCEHPPVMKYLEGIGAQLADGYGPARAMSALWVSLGCALLVPIGARLFSFRAGVFAAMIAALLPPLVAHGQIVGHESPTVLWWMLALLLALTVHDDAPDRRTLLGRLAWLGVAIGVATASRFVNGLAGVLCLIVVVVRAPERRAALKWGALVMPPVALATLYVLWPRLWLHPIDALVASFGKLSQTHSVEPFLGATTDKPGPHYFVVYLLATLPVGILLAAIAGAVRIARARTSWLVMLAWFVVPLGVMASPVRQDGVRYVLPCVVALAMVAGVGLDWLASRVDPRAIGAVIVLYLGVVDWRAHPYYLDYFGEHVGGASTVAAHGWFETAWWGEGLRPALDYVNEHAGPHDQVLRCVEPVGHLAWFREDLWDEPRKPVWFVWYAPSSSACPIPKDATLVYEVENAGLVFAQVWHAK